jgi:hypothetical protein
MKQVITLAMTAAGTATVPCPVNHRIRVLAVITDNNGASVQGEVLTVNYNRGASNLVTFRTAPQAAGCARATFAIGLGLSEPMLASTTVATGVAVYEIVDQQASGPVPDITWQHELQLTSGHGSGAAIGGSVIYELEHSP